MIPIRDTIQTKSYPIVNSIIIGINVLFFFIEIAQGQRLNQFILSYGLVPARYSVSDIAARFTLFQQVIPFISFMFLHGGFLHLLGNMWSLYIFGDNIEDNLGSLRYILFYLLCGLASGLSHLFINWHSTVPTIGASGAIAGVMGAYFLLYPRSKILTLIPIFFIPYFIEIPAFVFLGIWFILQFLSAATASAHSGGIAWWAHIGGFVFGMIFIKLLAKVPAAGITRRMRQKTTKTRTHRLQTIRLMASANDPHLYGDITVSPWEAQFGAQKMVNIPWGFHSRMFKVNIPPGVKEGTSLRMSGMGRQIDEETRGNLFLKVRIRQDWQ